MAEVVLEAGHDPMSVPILLIDGGLGTTLTEEPYNMANMPLWSSHLLITSPKSLVAVHSEFIQSGVDILCTATYQASYESFGDTPRLDSDSKDGYSTAESEKYMRSAVQLASESVKAGYPRRKQPNLNLDLGSFGAVLIPGQEYSGNYPAHMLNDEALINWHTRRISVYRRHPATWDLIEYVAFETVLLASEIRCIRRAAHGCGKKVWISQVIPGEVGDVSDVVSAMLDESEGLEPLWGIGINCTAIGKIPAIEEGYRRVVQESFPDKVGKLWFFICPDGTRGEVYDPNTCSWVSTGQSFTHDMWEDEVMRIVETARSSGVWKGIVAGGCCKIMPHHIATLRKRIDALMSKS